MKGMNPSMRKTRGSTALQFAAPGLTLVLLALAGSAAAAGFWNGRQIMDEVYRRHQQFAYVYEEHSMVMVDGNGERDTRQARRYSRIEEDGGMKLLYVFITPPEVKGVTLLAQRDARGRIKTAVYLPALGPGFREGAASASDGNFLGSDFSIEDLTLEILDDYEYVRRDDDHIGNAAYFVIDVYPSGGRPGQGRVLRRHFVRQDIFYITRTDHFDHHGFVYKQQTSHDLKKVGDEMWRADVILMEDRQQRHQSLIKINRRVYSQDYVPAEMFTRASILAAYPPLVQAQAEHERAQGTDQTGVNDLQHDQELKQP
jgi:hypothetical protein